MVKIFGSSPDEALEITALKNHPVLHRFEQPTLAGLLLTSADGKIIFNTTVLPARNQRDTLNFRHGKELIDICFLFLKEYVRLMDAHL